MSNRVRNSSMDSLIPIIVTRDGDWRGAANSSVQPTDFTHPKQQQLSQVMLPKNKFKEMQNSVQLVNQGFPVYKDSRR